LKVYIAGKHADFERVPMEQRIADLGLEIDSFRFLGYVSDEELLFLYRKCSLFVFPSLYEGFGLPVLEALHVGAVVLASDRASIPEIVDDPEFLFNPNNHSELAEKITWALTCDSVAEKARKLRSKVSRRFSWEDTAQVIIDQVNEVRKSEGEERKPLIRKPLLAFLAPLPPLSTGIADYCSQLALHLLRFYDIHFVVDQEEVSDSIINYGCRVIDYPEFEANSHRYDRVLVQMGNSPFHDAMYKLYGQIEMVTVMHDFYLSSYVNWRDAALGSTDFLTELVTQHGVAAADFDSTCGRVNALMRYPVSQKPLISSLGIITHSHEAIKLADYWFDSELSGKIRKVNFPKPIVTDCGLSEASPSQAGYGITDDTLLICSFGMVAPTKLNHEVVRAFLLSKAAQSPNAMLLMVGENEGAEYGSELVRIIDEESPHGKVHITGHVSRRDYDYFLQRCDIAVQLRLVSKGETSAAVFDALSSRTAVITNRTGSLGEIPDSVTLKVEEDSVDGIAHSFDLLMEDSLAGGRYAESGLDYVREHHSPEKVAADYFRSLEFFYSGGSGRLHRHGCDDLSAPSYTAPGGKPVVYVEVSNLEKKDLKSGIERVTRCVLREWVSNPPENHNVIPICFVDGAYRIAANVIRKMTGAEGPIHNDPIHPKPEDMIILLELCHFEAIDNKSLLTKYRKLGTTVVSVVYDLLPVTHPQFFPDWMVGLHQEWLEAIASSSDRLACISKFVVSEMAKWLDSNPIQRNGTLEISHFYLSGDMDGQNRPAETTVHGPSGNGRGAFNILMLGTIEPRKGYLQSRKAVGLLRSMGYDAVLTIIGKVGWKENLDDEIFGPSTGSEDFVTILSGIGDDEMARVLADADIMLFASEGEGFGLPIVEAARKGIPLLLRDIDVFREIAGESAYYFQGNAAEDLAAALEHVHGIWENEDLLAPDVTCDISWSDSATRLFDVALGVNQDKFIYSFGQIVD
jgi:glycosyltransferase involved in cell wall biosynthesis